MANTLYAVRIVKTKVAVGLFYVNGMKELMSYVDDETDPHICEYKAVTGPCYLSSLKEGPFQDCVPLEKEFERETFALGESGLWWSLKKANRGWKSLFEAMKGM